MKKFYALVVYGFISCGSKESFDKIGIDVRRVMAVDKDSAINKIESEPSLKYLNSEETVERVFIEILSIDEDLSLCNPSCIDEQLDVTGFIIGKDEMMGLFDR